MNDARFTRSAGAALVYAVLLVLLFRPSPLLHAQPPGTPPSIIGQGALVGPAATPLSAPSPSLTPAPMRAADDARVERLLAAMTLEQKIGQMFMVTLHGEVMTGAGAEFLRRRQPGAVSLFAENVTSPTGVTTLTNGWQAVMREVGAPPLIVAVDQEGGLVARLTADRGFTVFPAPVLMGAAGPAMSEQVGAGVGRELAAVGIHMNLAPVADLETYADNPIIFRRAFGGDPTLVGDALAGFITGMRAQGVMGVAKHFPGHGETRQDSHGVLQRLDLARERLLAVELPPFQAAMRADVAAIMVAHIWYPALDPVRQPASLSEPVVTGLLRETLGYDGLIMTDALDMNAVDLEFPFAQAAVMAARAGVDMLVMGPGTGVETIDMAYDALLAAVADGSLSEARVTDAARRVLRAKAAYGLLDWEPLDPAGADARVDAQANAALIDALFAAGVTVAEDRNDLVPVPADRSVAVIFLGTRYQIQAECAQYRPDIRWVGVSDAPTDEEIGWARAAAEAQDIAIVWTQDAVRNPAQAALVSALPPEKTVAVSLASPRDWSVYPNVAGYVALYSPLRPAVPAGCAALFGAAATTGRFPFTLEAGGRVLAAGSSE
jgi:beta-N-acetylhexosaminidase